MVTLVISGSLAALSAAARAQAPADAGRAPVIAAIAAAHSSDWGQAYGRVGESRDPLVLKLVRWLDYTRSNAGGRFAEISSFIEQNPDWPWQKKLLRRAEEAMAMEGDDLVADWLKRHPAVSAVGKARAAEILWKHDAAAGTAALRAAWIDGDFSPAEERVFAARFYPMMRPADHVARLDRLLWSGETEAARRMLPLVGPDYRALAEARLALAAHAADAPALFARVPVALRSDPGLALALVRWFEKKDMIDAAAQLLLAHPDNPGRPEAWWGERQLIARRLLATGNSALAYRIVEHPAGANDGDFTEGEFLSGYIALRYMKNPQLAFDHFAHVLARLNTPFAKARAAYWGGRAAEAAGKPALAAKWYSAGADHMSTFYGQLAAHQLGHDAPPHPVPEARPDAAESARFNGLDLVRAAQLLFAAGDGAHAKVFVLHLAETTKRAGDFGMLAALAEQHGRVDIAIAVARRALAAGMPLMVHGYPVTTLPSGGTAERPLLLAIVRQESGFEPGAVSRVGARGLMQLMPATAAGIAGKLQLPFSEPRLTADGVYNVLLGRSYLERLIDDFGGSYALAIAAYNAGPGRVRQWLHEFGDPRGRQIDMVDWIEMIPFTETRIYVQRVLENLQVYRGQIRGNATAFSLASDLAR